MAKITVENTEITVLKVNEEDYISLTDMAKSQMQEHVIFKWLSQKNTLDFLGEWENLYNPDFNYTEFGTIRGNAGNNNFVLSTKAWVENTNAIGIIGKTAKQWRDTNPELQGNMRDYAEINQLICMSNLENINSVLINDGLPQNERLEKLNQIAIQQMKILSTLNSPH